ncbi:MAG: hypothetical protein V4733_01600 [Verrucomicrobiota bacterium]
MKWSFLSLGVWFLVVPLAAQKADDVPPPFEKKTEVGQKAETGAFESDDDSVPKLVRVQVEFIELAHTKLTELLMNDQPKTADATVLRMKVQELVSKGDATVVETMIASGRSGEKATGESISEFIYPTEYAEPELPGTFAGRAPPRGVGILPTAFETRNLGSTLEIEPTVGFGNRMMDLRFVPEIVWHTGNTVWSEVKDASGNVTKIQMPDFYSLRLNTSIVALIGQYQFVAALSPKNTEGKTAATRKVMVFVKCDVLPVK